MAETIKIPTPDEFAAEMRSCAERWRGDEETAHSVADGIMCELLTALGYIDGVEEFERMPKWYA